MKTFIPHKGNPHVSKKFFGALLIIIFSATLAYFGSSYVEKHAARAQAIQIQEASVASANKENIQSAGTDLKESNITVPSSKPETEVIPINDSEQLKATIEEAKLLVPQVRNKNPQKALEEAKIYTKPRISEGKYIDISLAHQNMVLFENGQYEDAFLVSSGKRGMETPEGSYKIENKVPRAWSKSYGLFMPNWMALVPSGKFGIHELPEWPGGYKEGANHLGVPVSHGCVRLGVGAAKRVYEWSEVGTPVIVHE